MQKSNFHTHTVYSDGHDTVCEMIETAIAKGFHSLGFSDHSFAKSELDYCMTEDGMRENYREICAARDEYKDRIRIYAGIELDGESERPEYWDMDYDYLLVAVHEMVRRGVSLPIDCDAETQCRIADELYGGDWTEFAKAYYDSLVNHVSRNKTDIVAHFDLVTKYGLMPEKEDKYIGYALEAVREITKTCKTFELNTGAIARGLRTVPYPAAFICDEIKACGGRIIITSDCHYREKLDYWFAEAEEFLTAQGFRKNEHGILNARVKDIEIWE